jgi:quercetin dioxygenase-like cupin family protein
MAELDVSESAGADGVVAPYGSGPGDGLKFRIFDGAPEAGIDELMDYQGPPEDVVAAFDPADLELLPEAFSTDAIFCDRNPSGFSLVNIRLAPDSILPAHTHNVDCLYYVLSGWVLLGRRRLDAGAGFFIPAGRPYGYRAGSDGAAVLEFRHATRFDMTVTETSRARWQEMIDVAKGHRGWPGYRDSVALHGAASIG